MLRQLTLMTLGLTCIPDLRQPFSVLIWMQTSIPADLVMNQILASQGLNVLFHLQDFQLISFFCLLIFGTYAYMFFKPASRCLEPAVGGCEKLEASGLSDAIPGSMHCFYL